MTDHYSQYLRELEVCTPVHTCACEVDETPSKLTWWGRVKLLWRFFW